MKIALYLLVLLSMFIGFIASCSAAQEPQKPAAQEVKYSGFLSRDSFAVVPGTPAAFIRYHLDLKGSAAVVSRIHQYPFLGIGVALEHEMLPNAQKEKIIGGHRVTGVYIGSPAKKAGILPGDLITAYNGLSCVTPVSIVADPLSPFYNLRLAIKESVWARNECDIIQSQAIREAAARNVPVILTVKRGEEMLRIAATPQEVGRDIYEKLDWNYRFVWFYWFELVDARLNEIENRLDTITWLKERGLKPSSSYYQREVAEIDREAKALWEYVQHTSPYDQMQNIIEPFVLRNPLPTAP